MTCSNMIRVAARIALFAALIAVGGANAETYTLPPPGVDLIGKTQIAYARFEDTLMDIARDHHLGYDEILQANPAVDRWLPGTGTAVVLPGRHVLPDAPHEGIVLNVAEKRLYFFPDAGHSNLPQVTTHPVGIGRMDWETPLGTTKIVTKVDGPDWHPPESIKKEHLELYGEVLPDRVPAGPENPLGPYALRLGIPGYLIHGSNKRDGVGSRVSHGCVRLYNEDISELFGQVSTGMPVHIVNQPVKVGWFGGSLYIEVHSPLPEEDASASEPAITLADALEVIQAKAGASAAFKVDLDTLTQVLNEASGIPVVILD